ncbi:MAG TPA: hypothetical protein VGG29_01410 [Caulobacteraceae bacterium]
MPLFAQLRRRLAFAWVAALAAAAPALAAPLTRADIPAATIGSDTVVLAGYRTPGDLGAGAVYSSAGATPTGLEAIRDKAGTWFNLALTGEANVGWFGAYGDDGGHKLTAADIAANPQWRGVYAPGVTWDTVATNEAILAAFAGASSPGHTVWNSLGAAERLNKTLVVPTATYGINRQLLVVAAFADVEFASRAAVWDWQGPPDQSMLFTDAIAYAYIRNISLRSSRPAVYGAAAPLWDMDHDRANAGLSTQQVTVVNALVRVPENGRGVAISPSGGTAQGDTITWLNPIFVGVAPDYCLSLGGANALGIAIIDGDFQGCTHDAIVASHGQAFVYGTSFQDQATPLDFTPVISQLTTFGADLHVRAGQGPTGASKFQEVRSEGDVPLLCEPGAYCIAEDVASAGASARGWFAGYPYAEGTAVSQVGGQGRTFMVADDGGDGAWRAVGPGSTACVIQDPGARYAPDQWAGYALFVRSDTGATQHQRIASNTATAVTLAPGGCFKGTQTVRNAYHIGGFSGAVPPAWDSVRPGGSTQAWGAGGQGFTTTAGSNAVKVGADIYGRIGAGDYVVIPGADRVGVRLKLPAALIAKVEAKAGGDTLTLARSAGADVAHGYGYWGAPLADGRISYIDLDFNALTGALSVANSAMAQGRTLGLGAVSNYASGRPDWRRAGDRPAAGGAYHPNVRGGIYNQVLGPVGRVRAAALTYAPAIDLTAAMDAADDLVLTPTGDAVLNAPVPTPGLARELTIQLESAGGGPRTVRFGANFKSAGPLAVQAPQGAAYIVRFISDGVSWNEAGRSGPDLPDGGG